MHAVIVSLCTFSLFASLLMSLTWHMPSWAQENTAPPPRLPLELIMEKLKQGDKAGASTGIEEMRRQSAQEGNAQADLLKSMTEQFKRGDFGGVSTDLKRHNQAFTDKRAKQLVECLATKFGDWIRVVTPIVQTSRTVFGGTTMIEEYYSTNRASVRAQILLSSTADAMAKEWNPRTLGKEYIEDKTFPDGTVARVGPKKIIAKVGGAFLAWEAKLGALSAAELWTVASYSIDRACVKGRS